MSPKPIVAIVGRQNVGKSTLLNRLAGRRVAIVDDTPGTTRDRVMATVSVPGGGEFTLVDTGGLELKPGSVIAEGVNEQVRTAIGDADLVLFLVDAKSGLVPADHEIADMLRKSGKPLVLAANKVDNDKDESGIAQFYELGMGEPLPVSAYHGRGSLEVVEEIAKRLPPLTVEGPELAAIKVAIVGRPNVGKSTLLNALVGEERTIVSEIPGTTRDAIDTLVDFGGQSVLLIDTAGIKRRGKVGSGVGKYSVLRALQAVERADIALLVLDAGEMVTSQDMHVAGYIQEAAKGVALIVNKWDLVPSGRKEEYRSYVKDQFRFLPYAPIIYVSARAGRGVARIMPWVRKMYQARQRRLSTAQVNSAVQQAVAAHGLPHKGNRHLKVLYATQPEVNPPTFVFFVNDPKLMHFSYQRYLENRLREMFDFTGTPIRFVFKARGK